MLSARQIEILKILNVQLEGLLKMKFSERKQLLESKYQEYQNKIQISQIAAANTYPTILSSNSTATIEHEASTSQINQQVLQYLHCRGLNEDKATGLIISGYCKDVLQNLPFEFAVEARNLLQMKIEGF